MGVQPQVQQGSLPKAHSQAAEEARRRQPLAKLSDKQGCGVGVVGSRRFLDGVGVGVGVGILRVLGVGVGVFDPTPTSKDQLN